MSPSKRESREVLTKLEISLAIPRDVTMTDEDRLILVCEAQQRRIENLEDRVK